MHSRYWVMPSQTNTFPRKQLVYSTEQCFLRGCSRDVITETSLEVVSCKGVREEKTCSVQLKNPPVRSRDHGTTHEDSRL
jgi:hypothetical protein